jgi:hypothetical protein
MITPEIIHCVRNIGMHDIAGNASAPVKRCRRTLNIILFFLFVTVARKEAVRSTVVWVLKTVNGGLETWQERQLEKVPPLSVIRQVQTGVEAKVTYYICIIYFCAYILFFQISYDGAANMVR